MKRIDESVDDFLNRISLSDVPVSRGCSKPLLRWYVIMGGIYQRTDTDLSFDEWCDQLLADFIESQKKQGL